MDKTITSAMLIIVSMVMVLMLFNSAYPAIVEGSDAINLLARDAEDQMKTQIRIIHSAAEIDSDGIWQDMNMNGNFNVFIWVKNVGTISILGLESLDIFFGEEGNFTRIPVQSQAAGTYPYWTAEVEGGGNWIPSSTLRITIHYANALDSNRYFIRVTTPNGVSVDDFVGL